MVATCGRAMSHMHVSSLSVNLGVVKLEPGVAKSELVLSKVEDVEGDRLFMVLEVHDEGDRMCDVSNLVKGLVSIVGGNRF